MWKCMVNVLKKTYVFKKDILKLVNSMSFLHKTDKLMFFGVIEEYPLPGMDSMLA